MTTRNPWFSNMTFDWLLRAKSSFQTILNGKHTKSSESGKWICARMLEIDAEMKAISQENPSIRWVGMTVQSSLFSVPLKDGGLMLPEEGRIVRYQPESVERGEHELVIVRFKDGREIVHAQHECRPLIK